MEDLVWDVESIRLVAASKIVPLGVDLCFTEFKLADIRLNAKGPGLREKPYRTEGVGRFADRSDKSLRHLARVEIAQ